MSHSNPPTDPEILSQLSQSSIAPKILEIPPDSTLSYPVPPNPSHNILSRQFSLLSYTQHISTSLSNLAAFPIHIHSVISILKLALEFDEAPYRKWQKNQSFMRKSNESPAIADDLWKSIKSRLQQNTDIEELKYKRWYFEDLKMNGAMWHEGRPRSRKGTLDEDVHNESTESLESTPLAHNSQRNKPRASLGEPHEQKLYWLPLEIEFIVRKNTKRLYRNLLRLEGRLPYEEMVQIIDSSQEMDIFRVLDRCEEVTQRVYMNQLAVVQSQIANEEVYELRANKRKYMDARAVKHHELSDRLAKMEYMYCVTVLRRKIEIFLERHVYTDRHYHVALRYVNQPKLSYQSALKWLTRSDPFDEIPDHVFSLDGGKEGQDDSDFVEVSPMSEMPRTPVTFLTSPTPTHQVSAKKLQRSASNTSLRSSRSGISKSPSNKDSVFYGVTSTIWKKLEKELVIHDDSFMLSRVKQDINTIFEHLCLPDITVHIGPQHFSGDIGKFETFKALLGLYDDTRPGMEWEVLDEEDYL